MTDTEALEAGAIPVPEPALTPKEMIARAEAMIPMLREQQDDAEARGYYSETVHREFVNAGFSRCMQPRRFGAKITTFCSPYDSFCRVLLFASAAATACTPKSVIRL